MHGQPVTYSYVMKELLKTVTFKGLDLRCTYVTVFTLLQRVLSQTSKKGIWNLNVIKRYIRLDRNSIPYSNSVNAGNFDHLLPALHTIVQFIRARSCLL